MAKGAVITIVLDEKGAVKGVENFNEALGQIPNVGKSARQSLKELREEQGLAKDSADLLGFSLGVQLPRELKKFIGETKLIGPALATAFNVSVFAALGAALLDTLGNMDKLTAKIFDWSGSMASAQTQLGKTNLALVAHAKALKAVRLENALIGLTGPALAVAKAKQFSGSRSELILEIERLTGLEKKARALPQTESVTSLLGPSGAIFSQPTAAAITAITLRDEIQALKMELDNLAVKAEGATRTTAAALAAAARQAREVMTAARLDSLSFGILEGVGVGPGFDLLRRPNLTGFVDMPDFGLKDSDLMKSIEETEKELSDGFGAGLATTTHQLNEALLDLTESHRQNYLKMVDNIRDGAGRVFDAMLFSGKNVFQELAQLAKSLLAVPLRNIFQNAAVGLFAPLAAKGGAWGSIFGGTSGLGSAAATGISGGIFGSLKGALFSGGGSIASQGAMNSVNLGLSIGSRVAPTALIPGLGSIATSGAAGGAGAGAAGLMGGMAALGPAAAIAGAAFATSMLIGWLAGRGARKRAEEAARIAAIQEGNMFTMGSPIERSGAFGVAGESIVERDLTGRFHVFAPVINIQAVDVNGFRRYAPEIVDVLNRAMLTGQGQLADNIAWVAGP